MQFSVIKISALPVTPLQYFRQNVHYCCMGGCCFMCLSFTWWISYGPPAFLNATNFEEYTILHYTRYLISAKIKPAWTPQQTSFVKSAFLPKERRGVAISRKLSQRAEKSKNSPLIDGYYIFLLLLLLLVIKAFSIHQLLILRFLKVRCLCYSANLAYKQFMLVFNRLDSSGFVKTAFYAGQYSYGYAVPKKLGPRQYYRQNLHRRQSSCFSFWPFCRVV